MILEARGVSEETGAFLQANFALTMDAAEAWLFEVLGATAFGWLLDWRYGKDRADQIRNAIKQAIESRNAAAISSSSGEAPMLSAPSSATQS